ncbi:MAG TPA: phosphotransferase [Candidatus Cryosericum sp.]|nr:phosphotransferase [Candidatus Cryosericum sp.]
MESIDGKAGTETIQPRSRSVTSVLAPADRLRPMGLDASTVHVPEAVTEAVGHVDAWQGSYHGRSGLILAGRTQAGRQVVLKVVRGAYRMQELAHEYTVLEALGGTSVPVPGALAHAQKRPLGFLAMEQAAGRSSADVLREASERGDREQVAAMMGGLLSSLHHQSVAAVSWNDCIDGQLATAERHLRERVMSRAEFRAKGIAGDPAACLGQLKATRPAPGPVVLLHGDFRPRNVFMDGGRVTAVLDWSMADLGDPCTDIATMFGYLDGAAQRVFLNAYGLETIDPARLEWFRTLAIFLTV